MGRYYDKLFDLEILHDYYTSGKSRDFLVLPLSDTSSILKNYKCNLKINRIPEQNAHSGITVLYESVNASHSPLISITGSVRFRFLLQLANTSFLNFTDIPSKNATEIFYYSNVSGNTLTEEIVTLQPKQFIYAFTSSGSPDELRIFDRDNNEIIDLRKTLSGGPSFTVNIDMSIYPDAKYKFELFASGVSIGEFKLFYLDNFIKSTGSYGIIEIFKSSNIYPGNEFKIQFTRNSSYWKYFVVIKEGVGGDSYTVVDTGASPVNFSVINPMSYSADETGVIATLLAKFPSGGAVLLKSDTQIDYTEAKRKDIELRKNGQSSPPLINHLPSPEISKPKAEAYIFI